MSGPHTSTELPPWISHLADPVVIFAEDGSLVHWNAAFSETVGLTTPDPTAVDSADLFHTGDYSLLQAAVRRALDEGDQTVDLQIAPSTGEPLPVEIRISAIPDETSVSAIGIVHEQTTSAKQKAMEQREQAIQRAYSIIADSEQSVSTKIENLLSVVRETLGMEFATLSQVREGNYQFQAFDAPDDVALTEGDSIPLDIVLCERVVAAKDTLVLETVEEDTSEFTARLGRPQSGISTYLGVPVVVEDDVYGTFCFYDLDTPAEEFSEWEITFVELLGDWVSNLLEREQLVEKQREQYLNALLAHSSDRVSVVDETGTYQFVSPAIERQMGYAPNDLLGTSSFQNIHEDDREHVRTQFKQLLENPDGTDSTEYRLRHADGTWRWIETHGTNKLADPLINGIIVNSWDITEFKRREQRLEVLNRVLRHNLRNEMTVIQGHANTIEAAPDSPDVSAWAATIAESSERLIDVGAKARDLERAIDTEPSSDEISVARLLAEIQTTVESQFPEATVEIATESAEDRQVHSDWDLLTLVIENLLESTLAYNHTETPSVTITVRSPSTPTDGIEISVQDNGQGIPEVERAPLRNESETALDHGSGIGLWIAHWCVNTLGGELTFGTDSEGTTATVSLPDRD